MFGSLFHADWSKHPNKRWFATAKWQNDRWKISAPRLVGQPEFFVQQLFSDTSSSVLAGFDFPIGLPAIFGASCGLDSFRSALATLGNGNWSEFYNVARCRDDIAISRPFYPYAPGGTKITHLLDGLRLQCREDLLRQCERATPTRQAAAPMFWTIGAKQVGKAAISGWQEVIVPALEKGAKLWPFDGDLESLSGGSHVILAETYPAEAYGHIGVKFGKGGKTSVEARKLQSDAIKRWCDLEQVEIEDYCLAMIQTGFASFGKGGEDPFDALIGLLDMINVAKRNKSCGAPGLSSVSTWEGWILGQQSHIPEH